MNLYKTVVSLALAVACFSARHTEALAQGDSVPVSVNNVWPAHNPVETYSYYDALPVCLPESVQKKWMTFGQTMRGDRLVNSLYKIEYQVDRPKTHVCSFLLTPEKFGKFQTAILNKYFFEIFVADLPVHRPVGFRTAMGDNIYKFLLSTHFLFTLGYNDGQVVSASLSTKDDLTILDDNINKTITFTYSVVWIKSDIPISARLHKQLAGALTPNVQALDVHWLAIVNSFVLVLLVVSLLALILMRVVKSDLSRYLRVPDEELSQAVEEETGWKLLHADVFRPPPHRMWFCACVGSGAHLFFVGVGVVLIGCFSPFLKRGALSTAALFGYLLTSFIAGYISASLYRRLGGVKWAWNIVVTSTLFPAPAFMVWSILNTVAISYASTAALPFPTALSIFSLLLFVTIPLSVVGGLLGRRHAAASADAGRPFPCKTNKLAREIPEHKCTNNPWLQAIAGGFLPFSAIYIELHYVFASLWGDKIYTLYGVLLSASFMLLIVAGTYEPTNAEWMS
eukprot:GHVU01155412.1.p1 GENE.GHVU01155412.1~~GHVU01155412.1.p1  ORF type:complete len:510 (+),score=84.50 GHVU01155412.1:56-1585(+)